MTTSPETKPFWMVFVHNGDTPIMQHDTLESARTEASRLATKYPNRRVFILRSIAEVLAVVPAPVIEVHMHTNGATT